MLFGERGHQQVAYNIRIQNLTSEMIIIMLSFMMLTYLDAKYTGYYDKL